MNTKIEELKKEFDNYFGVSLATGTMTNYGMYNAEKCWSWILEKVIKPYEEKIEDLENEIMELGEMID